MIILILTYIPNINAICPAYVVGINRTSNVTVCYHSTSYLNFIASSSQSTLSWTSTEAINILEIIGICKK